METFSALTFGLFFEPFLLPFLPFLGAKHQMCLVHAHHWCTWIFSLLSSFEVHTELGYLNRPLQILFEFA
jgi:hypothetical protein